MTGYDIVHAGTVPDWMDELRMDDVLAVRTYLSNALSERIQVIALGYSVREALENAVSWANNNYAREDTDREFEVDEWEAA